MEDGTAFAAWDQSDSWDVARDGVIHVVTRPPGGSFGQEEIVRAPGVRSGDVRDGPTLKADAKGDLVLAWRAEVSRSAADGYGGMVLMVSERPLGGHFSEPRQVSAPDVNLGRFALDVNAAGLTVLAWNDSKFRRSTDPNERGGRVDVAEGLAGGGLNPSVRLGASLGEPGSFRTGPSVDVNPRAFHHVWRDLIKAPAGVDPPGFGGVSL